jgi:hypothetical protein
MDHRPEVNIGSRGDGDLPNRSVAKGRLLIPRFCSLTARKQGPQTGRILSIFDAFRDPISRACYERKIAQGKSQNQALTALTRCRCDVLFAMLCDGTLYQADRTLAA